jgi:hypothetical protein
MAMELFVFSDKRLETITDWNATLVEMGFGVVIEDSRRIAELSGSQPTKLRGRDVWIEYDHFDPTKFFEEQDYVRKERNWKYLLAFRFGGDLYALTAVYMAAAAYAKATDGAVLDEYEPVFRSWQQVVQMAVDNDRDTPRIEALINAESPSSKHG